MAKIVLGLSGGVDSSVAAWLLKQQGHDVTALFMINWHDTTGVLTGDCPWDNDLMFAKLVAKKLDIPFKTVDLSEQYRKKVVDYMFSEYEKGRTPNPDVLCNREIKFDVFLDEAFKLGAEFVATGHYCRKSEIEKDGKEIYRLLAGADLNKDQSYFLCQLNQKQLAKSLFPLGDISKPEVREIAKKLKLASADKKDSQGICFVGKVDLPVFLQQKLSPKKGDVIEIPVEHFDKPQQTKYTGTEHELKELSKPFIYNKNDGVKIGTHQGAHYYTIGQRKGLNIGGKPLPLFVIATDIDNNIIYLGQGKDHPGLYRNGLFIRKEEIHFIREDLLMAIDEEREYMIRHRYRQPLQKGKLVMKAEGLYIVFEEKQRGITAGQFASWYNGDELIGSGVINA
ncbi:MAG: tRNA 2-thiouridine(34) synthase MnmA [Bacteroidetes bacterium 4572_117]|nr:MAG: tRNA 2-thiouridine(34) synthase MnmA [Bacteroidetes bacterium 4572_117]